MFKNILVPLDGSRFSSHALLYAHEIADNFSSELILLRVVEPARPMAVAGGTFGMAQSPQAAKISMEVALEEEKRHVEQATRYLQRKARTGKCDHVKCKYQVQVGAPGEQIIKTAKAEKVDLIVMSEHGRGGIKRALLGSVADEVIRKSAKPVLVIRPKSK
jgi:nucleotide-binding universal stress UspA family protein